MSSDALIQDVYAVRLALYEAHEAQDGAAALDALRRAYELLEKLPDGQMLYVGDATEPTAEYRLPSTARQLCAKWTTACSQCPERISQGTMFYWIPDTKERVCMRCGGVFFGMERQR